MALILGAQCATAFAQEEDTQLWIYAVAKTDVDDDLHLTVDGTLRWREQARGDEQQTLRFTLLKDVAEGVRLGGGAGVFETEGGGTELRPHQEVDLKLGRFSARTRVEQRFFDGADRMEVRFRQRAGYTLPMDESTKLALDGEYLGLMQTRNRASNAPRNQWRARAVLSQDVSDKLTLGAGYLMIYTPRQGLNDRVNHVSQGYITWKF